jgi:hypothetical protein
MSINAVIGRELEIEANTIECCSVCGKTHYLPEMSECAVHGHFCAKCDCPCPVIDGE